MFIKYFNESPKHNKEFALFIHSAVKEKLDERLCTISKSVKSAVLKAINKYSLQAAEQVHKRKVRKT